MIERTPSPSPSPRLGHQLARFGLVGLASNAAGYLAYLLVTSLGVAPKLAMTALYLVGAVLGFVGNRSFTFGHEGTLLSSGARYACVHVIGYAICLGIQFLVVDWWRYPHQIAQAAAVLIVALYLFFALRHFVFSPMPNRSLQA